MPEKTEDEHPERGEREGRKHRRGGNTAREELRRELDRESERKVRKDALRPRAENRERENAARERDDHDANGLEKVADLGEPEAGERHAPEDKEVEDEGERHREDKEGDRGGGDLKTEDDRKDRETRDEERAHHDGLDDLVAEEGEKPVAEVADGLHEVAVEASRPDLVVDVVLEARAHQARDELRDHGVRDHLGEGETEHRPGGVASIENDPERGLDDDGGDGARDGEPDVRAVLEPGLDAGIEALRVLEGYRGVRHRWPPLGRGGRSPPRAACPRS